MDKTVVELFAGVGGFRCGLNDVELKGNKVIENNDWEFVWANQWEPSTKVQHAFECYTARFGSEHASNEDIFSVPTKNIPKHTLLVGGFPCQDYSVAQGLNTSKGIEGKKGVLWWAINQILIDKKPPFVLLENVDRLLISPSKQRGRDFGVILRSFLDAGYGVEWRVINAADYGMPQKRRRVFIFAYRKNTNYYKKQKKLDQQELVFSKGLFANTFPVDQTLDEKKLNTFNISSKEYKTLVEVSNNIQEQFYNTGCMIDGKVYTTKTNPIIEKIKPLKQIMEKGKVAEEYFLNKKQISRMNEAKSSKRIERTKPNGEKYFYSEGQMHFPENLNQPARTMLTSEGSIGRTSHAIEDYKTKKIRLLTPKECERINQFPDNWTDTGMPNRKRNFMMGNALVVGIIKRLEKNISKIVKEEK